MSRETNRARLRAGRAPSFAGPVSPGSRGPALERIRRAAVETLEGRIMLSAPDSETPLPLSPQLRQSGGQTSADLIAQTLEQMSPSKLVGLDNRLAGALASFYRDFGQSYLTTGRDVAAAARQAADKHSILLTKADESMVGVRVVIEDGRIFPTAVAALRALGYQEITGDSSLFLSEGLLPVWELPNAANADGVLALDAMYKPRTRTGAVTSQGDGVMNSDDVRSTGGFTGAGVKVGVMSDSANKYGSGLSASQATGDLPATVQVLRDGFAGDSDEGRAMMEIVHDVAPGADLAFRSAFWGELDFARGIHELADAGADIIVDDIFYYAEPQFADGPIAQAVEHVVNTHGVAYFSAAGNDADKSYESLFRDNQPGTWGTTVAFNSGSNLHDFDPGPGTDVTLSITVPANTVLSLQWDQAWFTPGEPVSNFDLYAYDSAGTTLVKSATSDNQVFRSPYELVSIATAGTYNLQINHVSGPEAVHLKLLAYSSSAVFNEYPGEGGKGTVVGHAAAQSAAAVAAAPYSGYTSGSIESYSSRGPTTIYLDSQYRRLATPQVRSKPDFTAPDDANTTFFYSGYNPDGDGYPNFPGTSAAAPHAAAVAALLLQQRPSLSPQQLYQVLRDRATDWGTAGWDRVYGAGSIDAYQSHLALTTPTSYSDGTGPRATEYSVQQFGAYPIDRFTVWFDEELNASAAGTASNYELRGVGADGQLGTADDDIYALTATYTDATRSVVLDPTGTLGQGSYRLTFKSGTTMLRDVVGNALDGGTDQMYTFIIGNAGRERILAQQAGNLSWPDVALNSSNQGVAVWCNSTYSNSSTSVYVQRYDSTGQPVWQSPLELEGYSVNWTNESARRRVLPTVAIAEDGRFVVAYEGYAYDGTYDYRAILFQRFNTDGTLLGDPVRADPGWSGTPTDQASPDVAILPDGSKFMLVWEDGGNYDSTRSIEGIVYNWDGTAATGVVSVNSTSISSTTTPWQIEPAVAVNTAGDWAVAWARYSSSVYYTSARLFNVSGTVLTSEIAVGSGTNHYFAPDVAIDDSRNFNVAFGNAETFVARYTPAGALRETAFQVNATTTSNQSEPAIAMERDTGDFIVTWQSYTQDFTSTWGIVARQYSGSATPITGEYLLNESTLLHEAYPAVAMDADGDAWVVWEAFQQYTNVATAIYGRWSPAWANTSMTDIAAAGVTVSRNVVPDESVDVKATLHNPSFTATGSFSIQFFLSDDATITTSDTAIGGPFTVSSLAPGVTSVSYYTVTIPAGTGVGTKYVGVIVDPAGSITEVNEQDNTASQAVNIAMPFTSLGTETQVNTTAASEQLTPAAVMSDSGSYVIAWSGNGVGDDSGIFFQRYDSSGVPQGAETVVNSTTTGTQNAVRVAMNRTTGAFVVAWASDQTGDSDVYFRLYSASGVPQSAEIRANTTIIDSQVSPGVAVDDSGNIVLVWSSGSPSKIYAQRFNSSGIAVGSEFLVDTPTYPGGTYAQLSPVVAMDGSGKFVVAWQSTAEEGASSNDGIYFQRYDASGTRVGGQIHANLYTTGSQSLPSIGLADNGVLVIAWSSTGQEQYGTGLASNSGIYLQRFDANNLLLSADFVGTFDSSDVLSNTYLTGDQARPSIAVARDGSALVSWQSASQDGNGLGVYFRRYNADGSADGGVRRANTTTSSDQSLAAVAAAGNTFVLAWQSIGQDGSLNGIYQQRFDVRRFSTVILVTGPSAGSYRASQSLDFTVNFSDAVVVNTTGGTPSIPLTIGSTSRNASYVSGSGTNSLLFRYTVQVSDNDSDGILTASPITLNGGTINDTVGNDPLLTFTAPVTSAVLVDNLSPALPLVSSPASPVTLDGPNFTITGTAEANGLVNIYRDLNNNNIIDTDESVAGTQQLTGGATAYSISVTLTQDSVNNFLVTATDAAGNVSAPADVPTITERSTPPASAGGPYTAAEGQSLTLSGSGRPDTVSYMWDVNGDGMFGDAMGQSPTLTWAQLVALGINDGLSTWQVRLKVLDAFNNPEISEPTTLTLNNVAPTVEITGPGGGTEGTAVNLASIVSDPAGAADPLTYLWSVKKNGTAFGAAGSGTSFSFIPDDNGSYEVSLTVGDDDGGSTTVTRTVAVLNVAPSVTINGSTTGNEGSLVSLTSTVNDPAGTEDPLTYEWTVTASNGQVIAPGAGTTFSLTPSDNGTYTVNLTVTDGDGGSTTDTRFFTVSNVAPNVSLGADRSVSVGQAVTLTSTVTDPGMLDTFTYVWTKNGTVIAGASSSTYGFTATASDNGAVYSVTVTDKDGGVGSDTLILAVTEPPTTTGLAAVFVDEDALPTNVDLWAAFADSKDDDSALVYTVTSNSNPALFGSVSINPASGQLTLSYAANAFGTATLVVRATDTDGLWVETPLSVTVRSVNDAPSFARGVDQIAAEDAGAYLAAGWAGSISSGPVNESGQTISFIVSNDNNDLFAVQPTIAADGALTYTPAANAYGVATVTVRIHDDGGTANGGLDTSLAQTFTITVQSVNDAPSFVKGADQTVMEDAGAQTIAGWASAISVGPANESGQSLNFILNNDNSALFSVQPFLGLDGTLTYTPAANAYGTTTVSVQLHDSGGIDRGGIDTSAAQTFTITITPVNDAPIAGADVRSTDEDLPLTFDPLANDSPGPLEDSQTLTVLSVGISPTTHGFVSLNPDGTFTFIPHAQYSGPATFTYLIQDDGSPVLQATGTVTITVNPVNDPPIAGADSKTIAEDGVLSFAASDLLANDSDIENNIPLNVAAVSATTSTHGTVSLIGGTITFTPEADYSGSASFTYTVQDALGASASGTVNVVVTDVNDAPAAFADAKTLNEDTILTFSATDLLGNDRTGPATEVDQSLIVLSVAATGNTHGTVALVAGTITYTPEPNYFGSASFNYTIQDNGTTDGSVDPRTASGGVNLLVMPVNDAPSFAAIADQVAKPGMSERSLPLAAIATGAANEEQNLQFFVSASNPALFTSLSIAYASPADTGTLLYTLAPGVFGNSTVTLILSDDGQTEGGGINTFSRTFTLTAQPATVADRRVFYNNSFWDTPTTSNPGFSDDSAIAADKTTLLPGQTATFANYTSFSKGLNGVMIDILDLPDDGVGLTTADFVFKVGNSTDPSTWTPLATMPTITVRPGEGSGGSDRITLIWPDNTIQKQWLQVTVLANNNTGLAASDLFYFGNAIGEAGNSPTSAAVDAADELLARANGTGLGTAAITNAYDYNRDRRVNATDQLIARSNRSGLTPLKLITPPAVIPPDSIPADPTMGEAVAAIDTPTAQTTGDASTPTTVPLSTIIKGFADSKTSGTATGFTSVTTSTQSVPTSLVTKEPPAIEISAPDSGDTSPASSVAQATTAVFSTTRIGSPSRPAAAFPGPSSAPTPVVVVPSCNSMFPRTSKEEEPIWCL